MTNGDEERFSTKAQFHNYYLRLMLRERNINYSKSNPHEVCKVSYLNELISRCRSTGHLKTFRQWYEFVINHLKDE